MYYQKFKTNIQKKEFYVLLSLISCITLLLLIWLLSLYMLGITDKGIQNYFKSTNQIIEKSHEQEKIDSFRKLIYTGTLLSYIGNSLTIFFFLFYIYLLRNKLKAGYLFFISWIAIFIAIAVMPYISAVKSYEMQPIQYVIGILITINSIFIVLFLIYMLIKFIYQRKMHHYEWYKIHIAKKRR